MSSETVVIALGDGSRFCPDKFFTENKEFPVCSFCDGVQKVGEGGGFLSCWLPYAANSDGDCFAYDSNNIGWYGQTGDFRKGGTEQLLPKHTSSTREAPILTHPKNTTTNAHVGTSSMVGLGAAAVLCVGGFTARKRAMKRAMKSLPPRDVGNVAMV